MDVQLVNSITKNIKINSSKLSSFDILRSKRKYYILLDKWLKEAKPGQGELREIAILRIKECYETKKDFLDLSSLNLTSLPVLPRCKKLDISSNTLTVFPYNEITEADEINASNNKINRFPKRWEKDMSVLDLSGNSLTQWPASLPDRETANLFGQMGRQCVIIKLKNNQIASIPDEIFEHSNNREIHLHDNNLSTVDIERIALHNKSSMAPCLRFVISP